MAAAGPWLPFAWQAQYTEPPHFPCAWQAQYIELPGGAAAAGPRLPFGWQAQYTEPPHFPCAWQAQYIELPGGAAAAGPRLPFAWQAQYTEPLHFPCAWQAQYTEFLEELRGGWSPLARGCLLLGRRSTQSVRTSAFALLFCVAGAVHRASWWSCGCLLPRLRTSLVRGRRSTQSSLEELLARGCLLPGRRSRQSLRTSFLRGRRSTQSFLEELRRGGRRWPAAAFCLAASRTQTQSLAWQAQYTELHCSSKLLTAPLLTGPLLITTHHNLSHPNSSQVHF